MAGWQLCFSESNDDCGGSGITDGQCDCEGNILDECGVCGGPGIIHGACDCDGNYLDDCDVCGGSGIPDGQCDCEGNINEGCGCGIVCPTVCAPSLVWMEICDDCQCEAWGDYQSGLSFEDCQQFALARGYTHMSHNDFNEDCYVGHEADCDDIEDYRYWVTWHVIETPCDSSDYFSTTCSVQDNCVSSQNYPSNHENNEYCTVTMLREASVTLGPTFEIQWGVDDLVIEGTRIASLDEIPSSLPAGAVIEWSSDTSETMAGWQLCFSDSNDDCGGSGIPIGACDCEGNILDECGVCGGPGITHGACDCDGNYLDDCDVCGGSGIPNGQCDCEGNINEGCGCGIVCPTGSHSVEMSFAVDGVTEDN